MSIEQVKFNRRLDKRTAYVDSISLTLDEMCALLPRKDGQPAQYTSMRVTGPGGVMELDNIACVALVGRCRPVMTRDGGGRKSGKLSDYYVAKLK